MMRVDEARHAREVEARPEALRERTRDAESVRRAILAGVFVVMTRAEREDPEQRDLCTRVVARDRTQAPGTGLG